MTKQNSILIKFDDLPFDDVFDIVDKTFSEEFPANDIDAAKQICRNIITFMKEEPYNSYDDYYEKIITMTKQNFNKYFIVLYIATIDEITKCAIELTKRKQSQISKSKNMQFEFDDKINFLTKCLSINTA